MKFLDDYNRLTLSEVGVLLFVLLTAFRICLLPAVLSEVAEESAVYVLIAGFAIEAGVCLSSLWVSSMGGLGALRLPSAVKRAAGLLLAFFFFFKVVVRTYEVVEYCAGDLFEQASPLLLVVVFLLTAALLSVKGLAGVARTGLMYLPVIAFLLVLSVFFASFNGYGYNLWVLLRPRSVGAGVLRSALWLGDGAVLMLADTRKEGAPKRRYGWAALAFAVALLGLLFFYLNFVYTYGSAGRYVRYAFVRMLTGGDPEELGAVDWPILLVWLLSVPLHLAATFYAGCGGLRVCFARKSLGGFVYPAVGVVVCLAAYCLLFRDKDGLDTLYALRPLSYGLFALLGVVPVLALAGTLAKAKERVAR